MAVQTHRIRVRYAETDQMGIAHHGSYVTWLEEARIAWLRSHGHSYRDLEAAGTMLPVIELNVRYRRPCRFDDELELATEAKPAGPSRIVFTTAISRRGELLAEATVSVASVDRAAKPVRIPAELLAIFA